MNKTNTGKQAEPSGNQIKGKFQNPEWQLVFFSVAFFLIFFWLYDTVYDIPYSATGLYFDYASRVFNGSLPYRDFIFEYPPFSLLFFLLPRLAASSYEAFAALYRVEVFVFALAGLFLVYKIACRMGKAPWKLLAVYTGCFLAVGPIIAHQYDIFPAVMVLLSLYFFWRGRHKTSWVFLALGTLTKIFPVVIAPVFLIYYIRNRQYRLIRSGLVTFAAVCLVIALPFLIISPESTVNLINYHSHRGIQIESIYSGFLLVAGELGLYSVEMVFDFGSWNHAGPLADTLSGASTFLLIIFLLMAYWFIYHRMQPGKSQFTRLGAYSLLVISILLVASKVLSPQYIIWLFPLLPLLFHRWRYAIPAVFVLIGGLTYYIFPLNYLALLELDTGIVLVLFFRNILLVLLAVLLVIYLRRMKASA